MTKNCHNARPQNAAASREKYSRYSNSDLLAMLNDFSTKLRKYVKSEHGSRRHLDLLDKVDEICDEVEFRALAAGFAAVN